MTFDSSKRRPPHPAPEDLHIMQGTGEWSALYIDGALHKVGDHYLIEEAVWDVLGITNEQSDDFMRGGEYRDDVAQTMDEVREYREQRIKRQTEASDLRIRASQLLAQADELERQR